MKKILPILLLITPITLFAQPSISWVNRQGGANNQNTTAVKVDANNDIIVCGNFAATIQLNPADTNAVFTSLGNDDFYFAKYNTDGDFIWGKQIGNTNYQDVYDMALDPDGNIYLFGGILGIVDMDPGVGTSNLTSTGSSDIFVAKYDADGNYVWAFNIGTSASEYLSEIELDSDQNILICGRTNYAFDFDPSANTTTNAFAGFSDGYVAKYSNSGAFLWVKSIGGDGYETLEGMSVDSNNNIYITGAFSDTVDFDNGPGMANISSIGMTDIYVLKLDQNGDYLHAEGMGTTGDDTGISINVDEDGDLYLSGKFAPNLNIDFNPNDALVFNVSQGSNYPNGFVMKMQNNMDMVWHNYVGSPYVTSLNMLDLNHVGESAILVGTFNGAIHLEDQSSPWVYPTGNVGQDGFIVQYDNSGVTEWYGTIGSTNVDAFNAIDIKDNQLYSCGYTYANCDFDFSNGAVLLTGIQGMDAFLAKYTLAPSIDVSVDNNSGTLMANQSGGIYQWIDCDNNNAPISGETNQSFTPTENGNYAVIITYNTLTDTSTCILIEGLGIEDKSTSLFSVYPNPTSAKLMIDWKEIETIQQLAILNVDGRIIQNYTQIVSELNVQELPKGLYYLAAVIGDETITIRFIKQ